MLPKDPSRVDEYKQRMSIIQKNIHNSNPKKRLKLIERNKKGLTIEQREKIRNTLKSSGIVKGANNPRWKGGVASIYTLIRRNDKYVLWRSDVFKRDNFTCKTCGDSRGKNLHAHHIKTVKNIIFIYNIQTMDDALKCNTLWDIENGITLCIDCHKKIHIKVK